MLKKLYVFEAASILLAAILLIADYRHVTMPAQDEAARTGRLDVRTDSERIQSFRANVP